MYHAKKITTTSLVPHKSSGPDQLPSQEEPTASSGKTATGTSSSPAGNSKQQLRWTADDPFVDSIAQLGGPDCALNLNDTLHLNVQKYCLAKYLTEAGEEGPKREKKSTSYDNDPSDNDPDSGGLQIDEAMKMQMEVQKRVQEQLEVQRQLQLRIEAQGKYLQKIIEEQQKISGVLRASGFDQEKRQDSGSSTERPSTLQKKLRMG